MGRSVDENLVIKIVEYECGEFAGLAKEIVTQIKALPSVHPEIIRCRDYKNWDTTWQNDWEKNYHYCPLIDGTRNGDWFCADAERKDND